MYSSQGIDELGDKPRKPAATWLPPDVIRALRAPFPKEAVTASIVAVNRAHTMTISELYLKPRYLRDRLDRVLGPGGYRDDYEVRGAEMPIVLCRLTIAGAMHAGIAQHANVQEARDEAFEQAARAFGIGWQLGEVGRFWRKVEDIPYTDQEDIYEVLEREPPEVE